MVRESNGANFYKRLRSAAAAASSSPLCIFPSVADVDSMCALKIVRHMLMGDNVRYSMFPVSSFSDVSSCEAIQRDDPFVILLINWGCTQDLRRHLKLGPRVLVFVVDSRRPIHLNNLSERNEQVIVLYTREEELEIDVASHDFDVRELAVFSDIAQADGDGSESEKDEDEDEEGSSDEEEENERRSRKRRRGEEATAGTSLSEEEVLRREMKRRKKIYYGTGTFHGRAAGRQVFDICHLLHKNTNELLWLACVSLTDQFVHERLTAERYQCGVMELELHVNSAGHLERVDKVTLRDGTVVRAPANVHITSVEEPRLMLLQEWSLYESMLCSSYVATKLKTWSDNGLKRLKLLLATMGIALVEGQQKFQYMSGETRKRMKAEFEKSSPRFGLTDLYYRGFQRRHGYSSTVSAADVVYGATALLECKSSDKAKQFWDAYSALSASNWNSLREGMQLAIKVQRATLRQGTVAITRQGFIKNGRGFRWLKLEDGQDIDLLGHPMSLTKFCYFLMDALREQGARMKPIICAARCSQSNTSLVVGVSHRPRLGAAMGNRFGTVFRMVAHKLGVEYQDDGLDAAWIRLDAAAVSAFMLRISEKLPNS